MKKLDEWIIITASKDPVKLINNLKYIIILILIGIMGLISYIGLLRINITIPASLISQDQISLSKQDIETFKNTPNPIKLIYHHQYYKAKVTAINAQNMDKIILTITPEIPKNILNIANPAKIRLVTSQPRIVSLIFKQK